MGRMPGPATGGLIWHRPSPRWRACWRQRVEMLLRHVIPMCITILLTQSEFRNIVDKTKKKSAATSRKML